MNNKQVKDNVHDKHRIRVREKVFEYGFSQLKDHEVLELLLFYVIPRGDTNKTAHNLIDWFGDLNGVLNADIPELCQVAGVAEKSALMIKTVGEICRRSQKTTVDRRVLYKTHDDYCKLAISLLVGESKEKVVAFCLNASGRVKSQVVVSEGTENTSFIDTRKIVQAAMGCDATTVVLAHNHPVGSGEPSASDLDATRSLSVTLRKLGVMLADHIIVDECNEPHSMYANPEIRRIFY